MTGPDLSILNHAGAVITAAMGFMGLATPRLAARLTGLEGVTPPGRSEILRDGLAPLLSGAPTLYALAGLCWFGAAFGRAISIPLDRAASGRNFAALGVEGVIGALLLAGAPFAALQVS
ncbi:MAG: hypothetical protein ACK4NP_11775 [Parvularculaceae bacterium]